MRQIARVVVPNREGIVRVMIYDYGSGAYLFLYDTLSDGPCEWDHWFETRGPAESYCAEQFGIGAADWQSIDDPQPGCQHDWIEPVRKKRDSTAT